MIKIKEKPKTMYYVSGGSYCGLYIDKKTNDKIQEVYQDIYERINKYHINTFKDAEFYFEQYREKVRSILYSNIDKIKPYSWDMYCSEDYKSAVYIKYTTLKDQKDIGMIKRRIEYVEFAPTEKHSVYELKTKRRAKTIAKILYENKKENIND